MVTDEEKIWDVFFTYYLNWLKKAKEPKTINDLSKETGLTRQTLYTILSRSKFKKPKTKTIIALANVWGEEIYSKLGMEKPEVKPQSLDRIYKKLPDDVKKQLDVLVEPYSK